LAFAFVVDIHLLQHEVCHEKLTPADHKRRRARGLPPRKSPVALGG
jgi:hypothetical protein